MIFKMLPIYIVLSFLLFFSYIGEAKENENRAGKILSFFNIVTFPNDPCDAGTLNGTCYTKEECSSKGGTNDGSCASGYGVCCVFSLGCGATISENNSYFVSSGSSSSGDCRLKVCQCNDDICQLRLDFETFVISGPSTGSDTDAVDGACKNGVFTSPSPATCSLASQCLTDSFSITNPGGSAPPTICGTNTGKHMYVDSSESCNDLAFILGTSAVDTTLATRSWTIRVTQYDCSYQNLAPSGCTEYYFGDTTGTISSYNFNSGNGYNLANQNHKICIRSEGTNCKICYTTAVPDFQISGSKTSPASGTYSFLTTSCCQYTANGKGTTARDCLIIPNVSTANNGIVKGWGGICGGGCFGTAKMSVKAATTSCISLCTTTQPFMITFSTDGLEGASEQKAAPTGTMTDIGFKLSYIQSSSNC